MTSSPTALTVRSADGTPIAYESVGTGPAVILVDAAAGFRGFGPMRPLAEQLAGTFAVFTYDRRGRGESGDTPPYAVDREVEDLDALVEAAGGSAFVYGFSSGGVLALHAALQGVATTKLALLEPPLAVGRPERPQLPAELTELVAAGRRGDAVELFNRSIGVPDEVLAGMRDAPFWPTLEGIAHTLVYDLEITCSMPIERLAAVTTSTLVLASAKSDPGLLTSVQVVADALPNGSQRIVEGDWHGVPAEHLAPVLAEFFSA